jgi:hypothetical protein
MEQSILFYRRNTTIYNSEEEQISYPHSLVTWFNNLSTYMEQSILFDRRNTTIYNSEEEQISYPHSLVIVSPLSLYHSLLTSLHKLRFMAAAAAAHDSYCYYSSNSHYFGSLFLVCFFFFVNRRWCPSLFVANAFTSIDSPHENNLKLNS